MASQVRDNALVEAASPACGHFYPVICHFAISVVNQLGPDSWVRAGNW